MKRTTIETENGIMEIEYGVTVTRHGGVDFYGVYAEAHKNGAAERCDAPDITASRAMALALVDALAKGGVTPVALNDVVSDFME